MSGCTQCKLHHQRRNIVHGQGRKQNPTLFLVGEAPGREEDDAGQPFIGGAGRVLNALLHNAGILRQDCFVSNTVRCRPPNNRTPELDELVACQGNLRREIDEVKPRLIVSLGDTAAALLTGQAVSTYRGSIVKGIGPATGYKVLITYHPAFVMRMRTMFPVVEWDLKKARTYDPLTYDYHEHYNYHPTRGDIELTFKHIQDLNLEVAVDIETAGDKEEGDKDDALNPFKGEIIGIAFAWGKGLAMQLDASTMIANWDLVHEFLSSYPKQIYANNKFDRGYVWRTRDCRPQHLWDVQTAMHLIYPAMPKKLDFLRSIYTNVAPYKQVYKSQAGGKYRPENLLPESLARLNCQDVDVTWQVCQGQKPYVKSSHMQDFWKDEELALDMQHRGVYIDKHNLTVHYASILPQIQSLETKFSSERGCSISSPKQLNQLLYTTLNLPTYDDKGKSCTRSLASTNEKAIQSLGSALGLIYFSDEDEDGERFEGDHTHKDVLADILIYRGLSKIASTYCEGIFRSIQSDERVHPSWNVNRTQTHRWSCTGAPMQGVPKHMRNIVRAASGHILFGADYKGMQIMGAGVLAEDWELCELMHDPNFSIHNQVLEAIKPHYPPIKKIQAKTVVFGKFFGRSDRDIAQQFHVPVKTVELWTQIFYSLRPKLRILFEDKHVKQWEDLGYVLGVDGHKLFADKATEAKNYPVQNFETRVVKTAMWKLREAGFRLILMGHDQLVCEEPDDEHRDERYKQFIEIMETARPDLYHRFPVDGGMGYYWNEV